MKQKRYTFPVLLDDGFAAKIVTTFPTTWFLDRDGRRVFVKTGWSEKLLEEFSWRIEALRSGASKRREQPFHSALILHESKSTLLSMKVESNSRAAQFQRWLRNHGANL